MRPPSKSIVICIAAIVLFPAAHAEKADRDKPANLEADRVTMDDIKKVSVFEGNVQLTQGTLVIRSDKLVVTQDAQGFQTGIATTGPGGLSHFRQKREAKEEYVDGEAERIEHDARGEKTQSAAVTSPMMPRPRIISSPIRSGAQRQPPTAVSAQLFSRRTGKARMCQRAPFQWAAQQTWHR
jgi:lipopolysaccharide transport protein LptA